MGARCPQIGAPERGPAMLSCSECLNAQDRSVLFDGPPLVRASGGVSAPGTCSLPGRLCARPRGSQAARSRTLGYQKRAAAALNGRCHRPDRLKGFVVRTALTLK